MARQLRHRRGPNHPGWRLLHLLLLASQRPSPPPSSWQRGLLRLLSAGEHPDKCSCLPLGLPGPGLTPHQSTVPGALDTAQGVVLVEGGIAERGGALLHKVPLLLLLVSGQVPALPQQECLHPGSRVHSAPSQPPPISMDIFAYALYSRVSIETSQWIMGRTNPT